MATKAKRQTKKAAAPRERKPTLKQMLRTIDGFLCSGKAGHRLWDVLSATRGPDNSDYYSLKRETTAIIRTAAFPRYAVKASGMLDFGLVPPDRVLRPSGNLWCASGPNHFTSHIASAASSLNLTVAWNAVGVSPID